MPLHVVHTLNWTSTETGIEIRSHNKVHKYGENSIENLRTLRYLRLFIEKPAVGWGVSLWQFDVFGHLNENLSWG